MSSSLLRYLIFSVLVKFEVNLGCAVPTFSVSRNNKKLPKWLFLMKVAIKYGAIFENKFWQRCFLDEQFAAALVKLPELANTAGVRLTKLSAAAPRKQTPPLPMIDKTRFPHFKSCPT